jgi:hypothetical protein
LEVKVLKGWALLLFLRSRDEQGRARWSRRNGYKKNCPKPKQILRNVFEVITS